MTPLRAKMIKAMQVPGFSVRTHESDFSAVTGLARYYRRAPNQLGDFRRYFEYLATERSLSCLTMGDLPTSRQVCASIARPCRRAPGVPQGRPLSPVLASLTRWIDRTLRLKVNERKSAVGRPWNRKFLGFTLSRGMPG